MIKFIHSRICLTRDSIVSFVRLASDLLLWEPMAPSLTDRADPCGFSIGAGLDLASQMLHTQGPDRFVMCRSGLRSYDDGNAALRIITMMQRTVSTAFEPRVERRDCCVS